MGTWSSVAARSASRRARATQSSIVASRTGTNGTTSVAPIRGCSPVWRERSIRSVATRMAASAASTLASGGATNVNTERLWAASAWTSSSLTPGTLVSARRSASMVAALRPSEKFGTHSIKGDGIDSRAPQEVPEPFVQRRVAGDHRSVLQHVGGAVERRHHAARFPDQHHAGSYVPRRERELPEAIEAAGGHVYEIERRGARASDTAGGSHAGGELLEVAPQKREILERKSGADERLPRLGEPRDLERPLALPGAESTGAPIRPISRYIVHDADAQHATHQRPDRHRVLRIAVQEVGRAVERIHDPHDVALTRSRRRQLFAHHARLRHCVQQRVGDQRLRLPVGFGDEIVATFFDPVTAARGRSASEEASGALRGASGDID